MLIRLLIMEGREIRNYGGREWVCHKCVRQKKRNLGRELE